MAIVIKIIPTGATDRRIITLDKVHYERELARPVDCGRTTRFKHPTPPERVFAIATTFFSKFHAHHHRGISISRTRPHERVLEILATEAARRSQWKSTTRIHHTCTYILYLTVPAYRKPRRCAQSNCRELPNHLMMVEPSPSPDEISFSYLRQRQNRLRLISSQHPQPRG